MLTITILSIGELVCMSALLSFFLFIELVKRRHSRARSASRHFRFISDDRQEKRITSWD